MFTPYPFHVCLLITAPAAAFSGLPSYITRRANVKLLKVFFRQHPDIPLHEAERATPKRLGTLVPRTCMHALGTGYARKSGEPLGFPPKGGDVRKHGGTPSRRDKHVTLAAISPPGVARGRLVGGQQSGLAGCKPPPLFTRGASSCSSQGQCQGEPWGASPRPSAPTYLPPTTRLLRGPHP